ncbi:MAG: hypothetical protein KIT58_00055 [Planctomycetota bacterium]|nr:hypothetical protein [Planctomycetota bacterium]
MDYGQGPFVEGERTVRAQILSCARGACLTPEFELATLTEVVEGMPRWDRVYQALPRRVVALLGRLRGVACDGYEWTLELIQLLRRRDQRGQAGAAHAALRLHGRG